MAIALIGPSGAGKGTQAFRIVSQLGLHHISTGDLFRGSLEQRTALGLLAKRYMRRGDLVPDEVVDSLIEEWLLKTAPNQEILFDGFPSTLYQAEFLDKLLEQAGRKLEAVIYLQVPDEE
ncbi:MAG: nucleoside monophosphate kinase, partial [Anaerolineae bacterium]|nr:nucleoside monophosphate kinase [Anaerolineae bacterium]